MRHRLPIEALEGNTRLSGSRWRSPEVSTAGSPRTHRQTSRRSEGRDGLPVAVGHEPIQARIRCTTHVWISALGQVASIALRKPVRGVAAGAQDVAVGHGWPAGRPERDAIDRLDPVPGTCKTSVESRHARRDAHGPVCSRARLRGPSRPGCR